MSLSLPPPAPTCCRAQRRSWARRSTATPARGAAARWRAAATSPAASGRQGTKSACRRRSRRSRASGTTCASSPARWVMHHRTVLGLPSGEGNHLLRTSHSNSSEAGRRRRLSGDGCAIGGLDRLPTRQGAATCGFCWKGLHPSRQAAHEAGSWGPMGRMGSKVRWPAAAVQRLGAPAEHDLVAKLARLLERAPARAIFSTTRTALPAPAGEARSRCKHSTVAAQLRAARARRSLAGPPRVQTSSSTRRHAEEGGGGRG